MANSKGMPPMDWKQKLGLTKDQEQKFKAAMQMHHAAMDNLKQQKHQSMDKLRSQVQANAADAELQATLSELSSEQKASEAENDQFHHTLAGFLTPKQQAQMVMGMMGHMHTPPPPPSRGPGDDEPDAGAQ
jgi:Spy/CpxP family protein refolding chaperone